MIYHITTRQQWQQAQSVGVYEEDSLETEGFIHFSTVEQIIDSANRYYAGQQGLVLLEVDVTHLQAELRYEPSLHTPEQQFPHLYGPLNLEAVVRVLELSTNPDGTFRLPPLV